MRQRRAVGRRSGFTLIELMIVVAIAGVLIVLAAPAFRDYILMQRLRSINAQLVTDVQFARSEAVARGTIVRIVLFFPTTPSLTCYSIYTAASNADICDCTNGPGAACNGVNGQEIRTVQVPRSQSVEFSIPAGQRPGVGFDPATGGIVSIRADRPSQPIESFAVNTSISAARSMRTVLNRYGRPAVCRPTGSTMDLPACP